MKIMLRSLGVLLLTIMVLPLGWSLVTGDQYTTVTSESMEPTYMPGDLLVVQRADGDVLSQIGQPVVVRLRANGDAEGEQYVHRVFETLPDGRAYLKGDNNDSRDPQPVSPEQVVGTPRIHLTGLLGASLTFTQSLLGRIVLGGIALTLLVVNPKRTRRDGEEAEIETASVLAGSPSSGPWDDRTGISGEALDERVNGSTERASIDVPAYTAVDAAGADRAK